MKSGCTCQVPQQCVTVPKMLNDTDTFIRYQIFSIPIPVLFSVPNFLDTGSETFFRYSILPIPVPRLFSSTKFFQYRFQYHQKNSRYREFPVPVRHTLTRTHFHLMCERMCLKILTHPTRLPPTRSWDPVGL